MSERDFLRRWSERKRGKAEDAPEPPAAPATAAEPETQETPKTDAEVLAELGLKDPDSLEAGDDFRGFMQAAVPRHIRNRALRKLWTSNPVLANLDGLNDYDGDFTAAATAGQQIRTAYEVGQGYARKLAQMALEETDEDVPQTDAADDHDPASLSASAHDAAGDGPTPAESGKSDQTPQPEAPAPRRMSFRFESD